MGYVHKRKRKRKDSKKSSKLLVTIAMALLMITSIIGFLGNSHSDGQISYGDVSFNQVPQGYTTKVDGKKLLFHTNPFEAERFEIPENAIEKIKMSQAIYVTFDPDIADLNYLDVTRLELSNELRDNFNTFVIPGISNPSKSYNLVQINCENATAQIPVLYFAKSVASNITYSNNCLVMSASSAQIHLRMKDRLMYGLYGIIKPNSDSSNNK